MVSKYAPNKGYALYKGSQRKSCPTGRHDCHSIRSAIEESELFGFYINTRQVNGAPHFIQEKFYYKLILVVVS